MLPAVLFLASFALYLATLCPAVSVADTAELFLCGANLDVGHPPGYALEALLVRLSLLIPAGSPFFRASLVAALAGAGTTALLGSTARALGARPAAAAAGAFLFAISPFAWWQATMVEKYSLQLMFAALVARTSLPRRSRTVPAAFAFGLALLHHPLALFLAPLPLLPCLRLPSRRSAALTLFVVALAFSLRPAYAGIRAPALSPRDAVNWGEPSRAGPLVDYLRLRYYSGRFSGTGAGIAEHLRHYPAELTAPGLAAGLFGLVLLALARPPVGAALGASIALAAAFAFRYSLPPAVVGQSHQNVFLLVALGSALALEWLSIRLHRRRALIIALVAFALGAVASTRFAALDGGRHLFHHDYASSFLRLAPAGAMNIEGTPYDAFLARAMGASAGLRPDLTNLGLPYRTGSGSFFIRRRYRAWAESVFPGRGFAFTDASSAGFILGDLIKRSGACLVTMSLDLAAPPGYFVRRGPLLAAGAKCPGSASRPWRSLSTRTWFLPGGAIAPNRTVLDVTANGLMSSAGDLARGGDLKGAARLLRECTRLSPGEAVFHATLARTLLKLGATGEAAEAVRRAIAADPDAPDGWCFLVEMQANAGAHADAEKSFREALGRRSFSALPSAPAALEALGKQGIAAAFPLVRRVFAESAVARALALPNEAENAERRDGLLRMARSWAPGWKEPGRLLGETSR